MVKPLETERLRLQPWAIDDWTEFRPISTDPEVMRYITGGVPWPDDETVAFVRRQISHYDERGYCLWKLIEKASQRTIGFCGLQPLALEGDREVEIGWWLARDRWGFGLATEAARCALADGFARAGLKRIIAIARPENAASRRIMDKIGMLYERDAIYKNIPVVLYSVFAGRASV